MKVKLNATIPLKDVERGSNISIRVYEYIVWITSEIFIKLGQTNNKSWSTVKIENFDFEFASSNKGAGKDCNRLLGIWMEWANSFFFTVEKSFIYLPHLIGLI